MLYDAVKASSGEERQRHLSTLKQELESSPPSEETLLLGLSQSASDVRQVVLGALSATPHSSLSAKTFIAPILDILRQCLRASSTSLSSVRLAAHAIKALSSLLNGDTCPLSPLDMQSLLEVVLATMAWGLAPSPLPKQNISTRQWRGGPGSAFAFDRKDSQSSAWRGGASIIGRKGSSASLNSLNSDASTSAISYAAETEVSGASDEDGESSAERRQSKLKEARRGVRYRSIGCISLMNDKYTRLLLIHWPRILLDAGSSAKAASLLDIVERDDSLSNRIAAVHAVQAMIASGAQAGFMAGAEEGSRLSAFTSLSSRMASMIVDLRRRLLAILLDGNVPPSLLEATLKCTRTLVFSTPQVKLRTTHSQVLRERTLQLCSRPDAASAVPAYALLSALVASDKEVGRDSTAGNSIISTLKDGKLPLQVRVEAWNTMTILAEKSAINSQDEGMDMSQLLQQATSSSNPLEIRQGAANFVQACLTHKSMTVDQIVLGQLRNDESAIIRSIAANCILLLPGNEGHLSNLLSDSDSTVRASAIRAIGVKIQSEGKAILEEQVDRLLQDESLLVRMRASWSLGNLCEISDQHAHLLAQCYSLNDDDERITVNAIRGVGALLSRCPVSEVTKCQALVESIFDWLFAALETGGPKLRWNVSACLARSVALPATCHWLASLHDSRLARVLATIIVQDSTFKVRLSAVQALLKIVEHESLDSLTTRDIVKQAAERALDNIGKQINQASFREAQLHAIPLQQSLDQLLKAMQSDNDH
jgi:HEAT repeat protein